MSQRIVVSGLDDEPPYRLYCEPEGAVLEVRPGDVLTITFHGSATHGFEVTRTGDGLILCRLDGGEVTIVDRAGRDLRW